MQALLADTGVLSFLSRLTTTAKKFLNPVQKFFKTNRASRASVVELHQTPSLQEKCGVFAVFSIQDQKEHSDKLGKKLYEGLNRLQGRGQDAAGMAFADRLEGSINRFPNRPADSMGKISDVFTVFDKDLNRPRLKQEVEDMSGSHGIAHNLYTTSKANGECRPQPIIVGEREERIAFAFNGNIPDLTEMKDFLSKQTDLQKDQLEKMNDGELMAHTIHHFYIQEGHDLKKAIEKAKDYFKGAYSIVAMDIKSLAAMRGPHGIRPLSMAFSKNDRKVYFSSETSSWGPLNAHHKRDLEPGELIVLDKDTKIEDLVTAKPNLILPETQRKKKLDVLERIYFKRPDSLIEDKPIAVLRREDGKALAREFKKQHPREKIDYVVPVYEGGKYAAEGFAEELGVPINSLIFKNISDRTFIEGGNKVKRKHTVIKDPNIKGKNIIVIDDSIVRGNTSKAIVEFVKKTQPAKLHFAVASAPFLFPNFYGIATPSQEDLIAANLDNDVGAIKDFIGADTLTYLPHSYFQELGDYETSHFDGQYPIKFKGLKDRIQKPASELLAA